MNMQRNRNRTSGSDRRVLGRTFPAVFGLLTLLGLVGCTNGPNSSYEEFGDRVNTRGFGHKYAQPDGQSDPVLAPGDEISVEIANNPDLSSKQPVQQNGTIVAPFMGEVKVAGLTTSQVRDKMAILLAPYVRDISVQVIALNLRSKNIYVYTTGQYGEIKGKKVRLEGDMTLLDLLSSFSIADDDCHIKVIRADPRHPKVLNINVRDIIVNGYSAANIPMQADDIVWMPPTVWAAFAQSIAYALYPVQVVFRSAREGVGTYYFIERGGGGGSGRYGNSTYNYGF